MSGRLILNKGKDKPVRQCHPWIFSGAIRQIEGDPQPGDVVEVRSSDGQWLAWAEYSPQSQIRARSFSWQQGQDIDGDFWQHRLRASIERRRVLLPHAESCRLVFAESDGLPGTIVDQYGEHLVVQSLTAGSERRLPSLVEHLVTLLSPRSIISRHDEMRTREGLPPGDTVLWGNPPERHVVIKEGQHRFLVDVGGGQKTGFYMDQAENRRIVGEYCRDRQVLNAFSYTGAFGVYALAAGAKFVTNLDTSADALELAASNLDLNGMNRRSWTNVQSDVFSELRRWRDEGKQFDLVILDPPKFATNRQQIEGAARGYKDINWLAIRLLRPGGILATFSCSGVISRDLFQKIVFGAGLDAGREVRIIQQMSQAPDHPVLLTFPEGAYLKGLLCHVT